MDPIGAVTGTKRVGRGGSWRSEEYELLRSACRTIGDPDGRGNDVGFRLVRSLF